MSSIYDITDLSFKVVPLPEKQEPEDVFFPEPMFSFDISASFLLAPPHITNQNFFNNEGEYDESWIYDAECRIIRETFVVERHRLMDEPDEDSKRTLDGFFSCMRIPIIVGSFVEEILRSARDMAGDMGCLSRKVLHLEVEIELPPFIPPDGVLYTDENDDCDIELATENVSIEGLKKVIVEGKEDSVKRQCAICLEKLLVGLETMMLPCSHLYHSECIVKWLEKRNDCPLCRSEVISNE